MSRIVDKLKGITSQVGELCHLITQTVDVARIF